MSLGDPVLEGRVARALLAGLRALALLTAEEGRALWVAEAVAERLGWPLHTWSAAGGVDRSGRERELGGLLTRLRESDDDVIWLVFEAGRELRTSAQRRLLRELAQARSGPALILVESDSHWIPEIPELERERLPTPDHEQLRERLRWIAGEIEHDRPHLAAVLDGALERLAGAGVGLELERFDRLIAEAILADAPTAASIAALLAGRRLADAEQAALERIAAVPESELAGFEAYLAWLRTQALSFDPAARQAGLGRSRGVALIGDPGCGKALAARVSASVLELALLRLTAAAFADRATLRATLAALERAAPVALSIDWPDGIDPEFVAALSDWLGSHQRPIFVILSAAVPPPARLCAQARLDAVFFIDRPDPHQRAATLAKLLARRSAPGCEAPPIADPLARLLDLARAANDATGADLAAALRAARLRCFGQGRALTAAELEAALADQRRPSHPPEQTDALREWARQHARSVD